MTGPGQGGALEAFCRQPGIGKVFGTANAPPSPYQTGRLDLEEKESGREPGRPTENAGSAAVTRTR